MDYALAPACTALPHARPELRERGPHYGRSRYKQTITAEAERRVLRRDRRRWRRILALSERMAAASAGDERLRGDWLALEEALHAHWLAVAIEHYELGIEAGLQRALAEREAPTELAPLQRARALVQALARLLDEL